MHASVTHTRFVARHELLARSLSKLEKLLDGNSSYATVFGPLDFVRLCTVHLRAYEATVPSQLDETDESQVLWRGLWEVLGALVGRYREREGWRLPMRQHSRPNATTSDPDQLLTQDRSMISTCIRIISVAATRSKPSQVEFPPDFVSTLQHFFLRRTSDSSPIELGDGTLG